MNVTETKDLCWAWQSVDSSPGRSGETSGSLKPAMTEALSKSSCKGKVLVVEDDPNARRAIVRILRHSNFVPFEAETVKEGIENLRHAPDWVLLDLMLPDGNGAEVLDRIKGGRLHIKVCLTTGCSSAVIESLKDRVEYVFAKPIDVKRLLGVLNGDPTVAVA